MVLKAWTLSCNYELKSSSAGPHFFLIYLGCEEDNIAPQNLLTRLQF